MTDFCPGTANCRFFSRNIPRSLEALARYRREYCHKGGEGCARLRVAREVGPAVLPDQLYPEDHAGADRVLRAYRSESA